jgi:hypothetical protein
LFVNLLFVNLLVCQPAVCLSTSITHRATKPFTAVTVANVLSVVFAAPLAAGIMHITALGLKGWQWLFILEGIPSVVLGLTMLVS